MELIKGKRFNTPAVLYAFVLPDGTLYRSHDNKGPYILATDGEGMAGRMEHAREDAGVERVCYTYAGTWRDCYNSGALAALRADKAASCSAIVPEVETVGADVGGLVGEMLESARELFGDNRITVQFGDNPPHRLAADHPIAGMMLSGAIRIAARGGLSLPAGIFVGFHVVEDSMRLCMRTPDGAEHWREVGKGLIMPGDFG